jgi:hypothetical protein
VARRGALSYEYAATVPFGLVWVWSTIGSGRASDNLGLGQGLVALPC